MQDSEDVGKIDISINSDGEKNLQSYTRLENTIPITALGGIVTIVVHNEGASIISRPNRSDAH